MRPSDIDPKRQIAHDIVLRSRTCQTREPTYMHAHPPNGLRGGCPQWISKYVDQAF
jgi:hypothetical protein